VSVDGKAVHHVTIGGSADLAKLFERRVGDTVEAGCGSGEGAGNT
jgi:hypothetical protein